MKNLKDLNNKFFKNNKVGDFLKKKIDFSKFKLDNITNEKIKGQIKNFKKVVTSPFHLFSEVKKMNFSKDSMKNNFNLLKRKIAESKLSKLPFIKNRINDWKALPVNSSYSQKSKLPATFKNFPGSLSTSFATTKNILVKTSRKTLAIYYDVKPKTKRERNYMLISFLIVLFLIAIGVGLGLSLHHEKKSKYIPYDYVDNKYLYLAVHSEEWNQDENNKFQFQSSFGNTINSNLGISSVTNNIQFIFSYKIFTNKQHTKSADVERTLNITKDTLFSKNDLAIPIDINKPIKIIVNGTIVGRTSNTSYLSYNGFSSLNDIFSNNIFPPTPVGWSQNIHNDYFSPNNTSNYIIQELKNNVDFGTSTPKNLKNQEGDFYALDLWNLDNGGPKSWITNGIPLHSSYGLVFVGSSNINSRDNLLDDANYSQWYIYQKSNPPQNAAYQLIPHFDILNKGPFIYAQNSIIPLIRK